MAYVALKSFDAPGGGKRRPGDVVPEAANWPNPQPWINAGWVKWVADSEISGDRWKDYDKFAGGRAVPSGPAPVARKGGEPAKAAAKPAEDTTRPGLESAVLAADERKRAPEPAAKPTKKELSSHTKDELIELAEGQGIAVDSSMSKSEIIEAILDAS